MLQYFILLILVVNKKIIFHFDTSRARGYIQSYFKITFMQEERCHMIQNTQSITINQRDLKHFSSSISGQRRDFQILNLSRTCHQLCVQKSLFVCTIPQAAILMMMMMMMVMMMMMCKCVTVSVCLYRFTSAARFFKDTIHVPPLTFTLFGHQKELYTLIASYLLLEKE